MQHTVKYNVTAHCYSTLLQHTVTAHCYSTPLQHTVPRTVTAHCYTHCYTRCYTRCYSSMYEREGTFGMSLECPGLEGMLCQHHQQ